MIKNIMSFFLIGLCAGLIGCSDPPDRATTDMVLQYMETMETQPTWHGVYINPEQTTAHRVQLYLEYKDVPSLTEAKRDATGIVTSLAAYMIGNGINPVQNGVDIVVTIKQHDPLSAYRPLGLARYRSIDDTIHFEVK